MNTNLIDIALGCVPLLYIFGAALTLTLTAGTGWRVLQLVNACALALALIPALVGAPASGWFLHGAPSIVVLLVVSFIGLMVVRFSANYLAGDPGQQRFQRWLQLTLACVAVVVTTNHFVLLILGWTGISLSMHQLLMFYPDRKRAALAAHKKFLFARLAEGCLVLAGVLLYFQHQSLFISDMLAPYSAGSVLSVQEQFAALLIASAAMVKCAQFPMHGWLIQVVEAPTPVSALLHAGIINLGGYLLLVMAPLMIHAAPAKWLLLIVAGGTCVIAALIMMTRISVKVMLAWSTVAQMGLMLVECALGQYGLALLHLVAHSCYKAYSFLNSGSQVENFLREQLALADRSSVPRLPVVLLLVIAGAALMAGFADLAFPADSSLWILLALMLVVLVTERRSRVHGGSLVQTRWLPVVLAGAYLLQKLLFNALEPPMASPMDLYATLWCGFLFMTLYLAYWLLRYRADSAFARSLYRNLYAGFYLDEWSTRVTLALWPARLPERARRKRIFLTEHEEVKA